MPQRRPNQLLGTEGDAENTTAANQYVYVETSPDSSVHASRVINLSTSTAKDLTKSVALTGFMQHS